MLPKAFPDSNAAPDKADRSAEDEDSPIKCGYTTVEGDPAVPELQSEVPGQGAAIGAEQAGTNIRSYSFQSPTLSGTSGMPASKK